jgi:hypothetical protein
MPQLNLWPPPHGHTLSPNTADAFSADLAALYRHIGGDERLLLIVDEIDRLLPGTEDPGYEGFASFLGQLRHANQGLKMLDFIVIGVDPSINRRERWHGRDNELYLFLHEVWMPSMDPDSAGEMIESIGLQMGIKYEAKALQQIVAAGGGQPFVTRQICAETVEDLFGHDAVTTIATEQAELGIEAYVFQSGSYLDALWRERLDDASRAVLTRLAESDTPLPRTALMPARRRQEALTTLQSLEKRTLVRRQADGYAVGWGVLRDWIRWIELGLDDD